MRINYWYLLTRSIEDGIEAGYRRAHKHTDNPTEETVKQCIYDAITGNIAEWLDDYEIQG